MGADTTTNRQTPMQYFFREALDLIDAGQDTPARHVAQDLLIHVLNQAEDVSLLDDTLAMLRRAVDRRDILPLKVLYWLPRQVAGRAVADAVLHPLADHALGQGAGWCMVHIVDAMMGRGDALRLPWIRLALQSFRENEVPVGIARCFERWSRRNPDAFGRLEPELQRLLRSCRTIDRIPLLRARYSSSIVTRFDQMRATCRSLTLDPSQSEAVHSLVGRIDQVLAHADRMHRSARGKP